MSDFALDVSKWVAKAKVAPEKTVRSITTKLWRAIIKGSPVDYGRFKGNWFASGATPSSEISDKTDKTGDATANAAAQVVVGIADWTNMTLANNLDYANVIEFGGYPGDGPNTVGGFSKQAPQGCVRVNVKRFQELIDQEARKGR